jgi:hypothetical protein
VRRLVWIALPVVLGLLLLAGTSSVQFTLSAEARSRPKPTPTPTATPPPTPTPSPTATPSPTPSPSPVTGTWQVVPSPTIDVSHSTFGAKLNGLAVVSASDIWAVGYGPPLPGEAAYVKHTLTEHWDGARWSIVPSPNPAVKTFPQAELFGVFALSPNDVWAAGSYENPSAFPSLTLIEHWDGLSWGIVPSPSPDTQLNDLRSISGVASNDIWAVGLAGDGGTFNPWRSLIEHWDGSGWSVVSNPGVNELFGVTALAANNVWAVAVHTSPNVTDIVEHWDGTRWANVPAPSMNANGGAISLRAVAAVSATDIWAVGDEKNPLTNAGNTITEHWNGTAWTVSSEFSRNSYLPSVTASGSADVWAVDGSGLMQTQHWDGIAWSIIPTPNPPPGSGLLGVTAVSSGNVWAVGWNGATTLIEHFTQG